MSQEENTPGPHPHLSSRAGLIIGVLFALFILLGSTAEVWYPFVSDFVPNAPKGTGD